MTYSSRAADAKRSPHTTHRPKAASGIATGVGVSASAAIGNAGRPVDEAEPLREGDAHESVLDESSAVQRSPLEGARREWSQAGSILSGPLGHSRSRIG